MARASPSSTCRRTPARRSRRRCATARAMRRCSSRCDLTDVAALRAALARVRDELGPAAVLVNNAANDLRQTLRRGHARSVRLDDGGQPAPRLFRLPGGGAADDRARAAARSSTCRRSPGCSACPTCRPMRPPRRPIVGLTNSLARQYGQHRIRVNAIAPGLVLTEKQRRLWFHDDAKLAAGRGAPVAARGASSRPTSRGSRCSWPRTTAG